MSIYLGPTLFLGPNLYAQESEIAHNARTTHVEDVEITDEFADNLGEWFGYASIDQTQQTALREQKHVDIRSFVPDQPAAAFNMLFMDRLSMYNLDGFIGKPWNATITYQIGDVVEYETGGVKKVYRAIETSTNKVPNSNPSFWTEIPSPGAKLSRISSNASPAARVIVQGNEQWTFGEVGPQSDRNNWNGIKVTCKANQTTTTLSVIAENG